MVDPIIGLVLDTTYNKIEKDPNGLTPKSPGAKLDADKNDLDLVLGDFANALEQVGLVGTFGANKYSRHGWLGVPSGIDRYSSAMLRHYFKHKSGELIDPESGLYHLAHLAWNALAILELMYKEENKEMNSNICYNNTEQKEGSISTY
jgi:hypothetical protein